jgi:hypothetical protein
MGVHAHRLLWSLTAMIGAAPPDGADEVTEVEIAKLRPLLGLKKVKGAKELKQAISDLAAHPFVPELCLVQKRGGPRFPDSLAASLRLTLFPVTPPT